MKWQCVTGMGLIIAVPAHAENTSADRILNAFSSCKAMTRSDERLTCFETTVDKLTAQVKSRDVTIVDSQDVRKAKRSLFGFALPNIDLFTGDREHHRNEQEFAAIDSTVASARDTINGRAEIVLADESHAVWQTAEEMPFPPRQGDKVHIKAGVLNGYFLTTGGKTYRAIRLR